MSLSFFIERIKELCQSCISLFAISFSLLDIFWCNAVWLIDPFSHAGMLMFENGSSAQLVLMFSVHGP